jgi:hypothetical protein
MGDERAGPAAPGCRRLAVERAPLDPADALAVTVGPVGGAGARLDARDRACLASACYCRS